MMGVDDDGIGGFQGLVPHIPLRGPDECLIGKIRHLRHPHETIVASLRQNRRIEEFLEIGHARLLSTRMGEMIGEMEVLIHFNQQIHQIDQRKRGAHPLSHLSDALGQMQSFERRHL